MTPLRPVSLEVEAPTEVRVRPGLEALLKSSMVTAAAGTAEEIRQNKPPMAPRRLSRPHLPSFLSINTPPGRGLKIRHIEFRRSA